MRGRVRKILVAVLAGLVVIVAVTLAILPEVVRRVAVDQVPKLTGRVLTLDDVDLNLFTGHLALKGARIFKSGVNERAVEFERLDIRLDYLPFLFHKVRVTEISLAGAKMSILRRGPTEFDFSDVLERLKGSKAEASGQSSSSAKWTVELDQISLQRLAVIAHDQTTSPESEWRIDDMALEARNLTLGGPGRPGSLEARLKLNGTPIAATVDSLVLQPLATAARVTVDGFDLAPLRPYLAGAPAAPRAGRVNAALALAIELAPAGLKRGTVRGGVALNGLEVLQTGRTDPFLTVPGLSVKINDADLVARAFTIGAIEVDGLSLRAVRDAQEKIDLVALGERPDTGGPAPAASDAGPTTPAAAAEPAPPQLKLKIEQVALRNGTATFRDEAVKPITTLAITPFRSIGKLAKGSGGEAGDELKIDAVTFAAGSADVAPPMEQHLTKVADFLRGAPNIKLAMAPVAAPRDVESLRAQEVTLRIQRLQLARGLPDFNAAVATAFKEQLPDVTPPKTGEEQRAVFKEREPAPDTRMQELQARRLEGRVELTITN